MLNKEQRQQAEKMGQELAPTFAKCSKLAKIWIAKNQERRQAHEVAGFWQWVGTGSEWTHESISEEEKEQARAAKKNPHEWAEGLDLRYKIESEKETAERAAWFNYRNYLYYICELVAEKLRPFASNLYNTRGEPFKEWAEIISPKEPKDYTPARLYVNLYLNAVFDESFCLDIHTNGGGACGASSKSYAYYKKNNATEGELNPKEPQPMTAKQYAQRLAIVKGYEQKAQELQREQIAKAKAWGLLDACELLRYPSTEKYR